VIFLGHVRQVLGKILIGLLQILSELPAALALSFPDAFTAVLRAMKIFLFDIFEVFRVDCITPLSVHAKFMITMALPLLGAAIVKLLCCVADARASRGGADAELVAERRAENKATASYRTCLCTSQHSTCSTIALVSLTRPERAPERLIRHLLRHFPPLPPCLSHGLPHDADRLLDNWTGRDVAHGRHGH
jgi:hypothetical protein